VRDIIRMVVVLTLICAASGFALAVVHDFTKEPIEYSRLKYVKEPAVKAVLKGYDNDPIKDRISIVIGKDRYGRPVKLIIFPAKKAGKIFAVAFETSGKGYHGDIGVMVGIDVKHNKLTGIAIVSHSETPGLGARIVEKSFTGSFKGKSLAKELTTSDINALSGATFSTKGVLAAVNKARAIFKRYHAQIVR